MTLKLVTDQPDEEIIDLLELALEMAKQGVIQDVVVVASIKDEDGPAFWRGGEFNDRWRILGALEYAKDMVHRG
ncbi:hypothetical protein P6F26_16815 [Roseibacterium sp. SDUM158017]|uniref:hypothetical protein n=1 Tax=Roseicyclus salinarum TaxID=3036773 RepID=UPI002414E3D5|nr:hypothetical protein [Roseibacterium sp. SDUM158017]MDG4650112.1 hypothetical protein [Roseibacterium sp. SDUM158017]